MVRWRALVQGVKSGGEISGALQIMPVMWARFDRIWYGHSGKLIGTKTSQPLTIPLDHVFEVSLLRCFCFCFQNIVLEPGEFTAQIQNLVVP